MKEIFKINVHSFVDLITNSSSELFVCHGAKSIEAIEEILEYYWKESFSNKSFQNYLCHFYGVKEGDIDFDNYEYLNLWEDVFEKPVVSDFSIDTESALYKEYQKAQNFHRPARFFLQREEKMKKIVKQEFCLKNRFHRNIKVKNKKYDKLLSKYERAGLRRKIAKREILSNKVNKMNNVPEKYDFFIDYDISLKKGDIILSSKSDNSTPYFLAEFLESVLNAKKYHLG